MNEQKTEQKKLREEAFKIWKIESEEFETRSVKNIIKTRGKNRDALIKKAQNDFINKFKLLRKKVFTRNDLKGFFDFDGIKSERTKRQFIQKFLELLINLGVLEKFERKETYFLHRRDTLRSEDYESFKVLMEKNGYRKNKELKPEPKELDYLTEVIGFDAEQLPRVYMWGNSSKPKNKRGCYSRGEKSIRVMKKQRVKTYYAFL